MTPKQLDYIVNGVPVRFYKRPADGVIYAKARKLAEYRAAAGMKPGQRLRSVR